MEPASSCWELVELKATGCQSPGTPCNHGRKGHQNHADACDGSRKMLFLGNSLFYIGQILFSSSRRLYGVILQPLWDCSFSMEHHVFAAVSCEQQGEGRRKAVICSHMAENDNISPNQQKHFELNFLELLPCQGKQQLLVRGKRRT